MRKRSETPARRASRSLDRVAHAVGQGAEADRGVGRQVAARLGQGSARRGRLGREHEGRERREQPAREQCHAMSLSEGAMPAASAKLH